MGNNSYIKIDDAKFKMSLRRIALVQAPKEAENGVGKAMLQIMGDAVLIEPTAPLKTGRLRASGSVFVQNMFKGDSQENVVPREGQIRGVPTPAKSFNVPLKSAAIIGTVLFNTEYAWEVHENQPVNWSQRRATPFHEPSSDILWLSSKMFGFKKKYFQIVADHMRKNLGR